MSGPRCWRCGEPPRAHKDSDFNAEGMCQRTIDGHDSVADVLDHLASEAEARQREWKEAAKKHGAVKLGHTPVRRVRTANVVTAYGLVAQELRRISGDLREEGSRAQKVVDIHL